MQLLVFITTLLVITFSKIAVTQADGKEAEVKILPYSPAIVVNQMAYFR